MLQVHASSSPARVVYTHTRGSSHTQRQSLAPQRVLPRHSALRRLQLFIHALQNPSRARLVVASPSSGLTGARWRVHGVVFVGTNLRLFLESKVVSLLGC